MSVKSLIGVAWEEPTKGSDRVHYRTVLDLGILPGFACRIVQNTKGTKEKSPTHLIFFSRVDGQDIRVGALWPHTNGEGKRYLIGHIEVAAFGEVALKGGARVDLRLASERIGVRLSEVAERRTEKSPTHQLWRMRPKSKSAVAAAVPAAAAEASHETVEAVNALLAGEPIEDGESFEGEEEDAGEEEA